MRGAYTRAASATSPARQTLDHQAANSNISPANAMRSSIHKLFLIFCASIVAIFSTCAQSDWLNAGLIYDDFPLTLADGHRTELLGPIFNYEQKETQEHWAFPPLGSYTHDPVTEYSEFDLLYPILTYDQFGREYRWQLFQLLSFAGGSDQSETMARRFTIFPFYFQQRSPDKIKNYTALLPIYGHLKNRLFRDEVNFVMLPLYVQSKKKDVVTDNWLFPFFHLRHGDGLNGWQFWPAIGHEHKDITTRTNIWGDEILVPGHDNTFAVWPFYLASHSEIGTTNPVGQVAVLPLFSLYRSPQRDCSTFMWPFINIANDREKKYHEVGAPWPLVVFARGEGKDGNRVWPLFSHFETPTLMSEFYLWPFYYRKHFHAEPLDRTRWRIMYFLYSDVTEKNTETGEVLNRRDCWPLFHYKKDMNGDTKLQIFAPLEPILPNNKSIERDYSPVWSVFRAEKNAKTGATSQSVLWNLYRRDTAPDSKKISLLFGLFQYQSNPQGSQFRIFYIPLGKAQKQKLAEQAMILPEIHLRPET